MSNRIVQAALVGGAVLLTSTTGNAITGLELLSHCEKLERGSSVEGGYVRLPSDRDAYLCWGYFGAVQDPGDALAMATYRPVQPIIPSGPTAAHTTLFRPGIHLKLID
jgi:hypothetical protein